MTLFTIKRGDTSPALSATLLDPDGEPADLSLAERVEFRMNAPYDDELITGSTDDNVSYLNKGEGRVQYDWQPGDTDTVGQKEAEFVVEYSNGNIRTYPNDGFFYINIEQDIEEL